ncbi:MAG: hypothetical protein WD770_04895 [Actinomycetota bacterium]
MSRRALCLLAAALVGLTACPDDGPDTPPSAGPTTGSVSPPPDVPDPKLVPVGTLLREGATPDTVLYGDLNGVAPEEIVVLSTTPAQDPSLPPRPFLDAFAWDPAEGAWVKVFDASAYEDPAIRPGPILAAAGTIGQSVLVLELVDFVDDGTPELVVGVQSYGAALGPLDLWVLSWPSEAFAVEFTRSTQRGGQVSVEPRRVTLEAGLYAPDDPGCCPSRIETVVIGWDPESGRIVVLERTEREAPEG